MDDRKAELKCAQINLLHAGVEAANLMKYKAENKVAIMSTQVPYIHLERGAGIDTKYRIFTSREARIKTFLIITNTNLDATLISQFSEQDTITLEVTRGNTAFIVASRYFERQ